MLVGSYNFSLVVLSVLVAILASYTALNMAKRMHAAQSKHASLWHIGGSVTMGVGIWSMHFIGMLAFSLPIALGYDLTLTLLSLLIAIVVSYFALWQVAAANLSKWRIAISATGMGLGIAAMHYTGMEAMLMLPAIQYQVQWLMLSIVIAIVASYAALRIMVWIIKSRKHHSRHILAAIFMGLAIVGMHYTGMMAAQFPSNSFCQAAAIGIQPQMVAILVGLACSLLFLGSNLASFFDAKTAFFIQSLELANQELRVQSIYDPLTKLPNRVLLEERVKIALQQAIHHQYGLAYLVVNLDGFKAINESMGLAIGDRMLTEIANRLRAVVEDQFTVARIAADEFVVVLEQIMPEEAAIQADRMIMTIKQPVRLESHELVISASIGISFFPHDGESYHDLSFHANTAMQYMKKNGKNDYQYYEESMDKQVAYQLALIADLRHAISLKQLSLHYQPKFDLSANCVNGAEALLRWEHPQYGFISPATFIPLAEESGLIISIGDWVLDQACYQLHTWQSIGYEHINISVNLSLVQLNHKNIYQKIVDALDRWDIPPASLTIEVTESTAMQNVEHSIAVLNNIAALGVKISIDDFGTGYSSLLYFKRLPASELKIDRGFIDSVCTSSEDGLLVSGMISLGHEFGLKVVAEGVEKKEQKDFLESLGCDILQGFYIGKPQPPLAFMTENKQYLKMQGMHQNKPASDDKPLSF